VFRACLFRHAAGVQEALPQLKRVIENAWGLAFLSHAERAEHKARWAAAWDAWVATVAAAAREAA